MKTILNKEIPQSTRGILYLCKYNYNDSTIKVEHEVLFDFAGSALEAYANIPNPESQLVTGVTYIH